MKTQATLRFPKGVADLQAQLAYVEATDGNIEALDLRYGEIVARSDFVATPLAADGELLIAYTSAADDPASVLLIAALRHDAEIRPTWEAKLDLPDWVDRRSGEADAFELEAAIDEGSVTANWRAVGRYRGGAPPPSDIEEVATRSEQGTANFARATGVSVAAQKRREFPPQLEAMPRGALADRQMVPYRAGLAWSTEPWHVGGADFDLVRSRQGAGIAVLRREAGTTAETKLSNDPDAEAAVSPDGAFIFVHEPNADARSWHVFSNTTGERVAGIPFDLGTEWIAVVEDRVVFYVVEDIGTLSRQMLRCRSLETGEQLWSHSLGEVALKAPPPPMP